MKTLIKNGFVVDPANGVNAKLNILVDGGKIALISDKEIEDYDTCIDASGKYVTPGFIDIHMHEDPLDNGSDRIQWGIGLTMLRMGVTTAIAGNCGDNYGDPVKYLDLMDRDGAPVNMGLFAGHRYFREAAGQTDKYAHVDEPCMEKMKAGISEALDAGCIGISYGLRYVPGTDEKELLETAALCRDKNRLVSVHVRDDAANVFTSIDEVIRLSRDYGIPVEISHIGSMGGFGQMEKVLEMLDCCKANNLDVTADCYPYYAFSTWMQATTFDDGFLERYNTDYSVIEICAGKYKGQRCTEEIFKELRAADTDTLTVCHVMKEEDVDMAMVHPDIMVASDGVLDHGQGHPRASGTFPRFLNNYVKTGRVPLYTAINKMSALPARKLGLTNKGRLNVGADADIVIFDLNAIRDRATFEEPLLPPCGINYVIIDGQIALKGGEIINGTLGRAVRKV